MLQNLWKGGDFMERLVAAPRPVNTGELRAVNVPNSVEDPRFPKVVSRTRPTDPIRRALEEMVMAEPGRFVVTG